MKTLLTSLNAVIGITLQDVVAGVSQTRTNGSYLPVAVSESCDVNVSGLLSTLLCPEVNHPGPDPGVPACGIPACGIPELRCARVLP